MQNNNESEKNTYIKIILAIFIALLLYIIGWKFFKE